MPELTLLIVTILLFLILSAFFSGSEIAFISANKLGVEVEKDKGTRRGNIIARFYKQPKDFLGAMLVGNNIALVVFSVLMSKLLEPWLAPLVGDGGLLLLANTVIITLIILIFGEFLPKTIFRLFANETLFFLAYPLILFKMLLKVPTWGMIKFSNLLLKSLFRLPSEGTEDVITRLDLQDFVEGSVSVKKDDIEADMFKNALYLKRVKVGECMVPRTEIQHLDISAGIDALVRKFQETGHSRIMITDGDIDNILGYIHHQHLLDKPKSLHAVVKDISFVPETMSAKDLMLDMIYSGINIACVVDEFGGLAGLITLEDILEEIFGEIEDEYDKEAYTEIQISSNEYVFSGRLEIDYINEKYPDLQLPEGDYHTLSGYVVMTSGTIPEEGDELELDGFRFIFESMSEKKIETVRVIKLHEQEED